MFSRRAPPSTCTTWSRRAATRRDGRSRRCRTALLDEVDHVGRQRGLRHGGSLGRPPRPGLSVCASPSSAPAAGPGRGRAALASTFRQQLRADDPAGTPPAPLRAPRATAPRGPARRRRPGRRAPRSSAAISSTSPAERAAAVEHQRRQPRRGGLRAVPEVSAGETLRPQARSFSFSFSAASSATVNARPRATQAAAGAGTRSAAAAWAGSSPPRAPAPPRRAWHRAAPAPRRRAPPRAPRPRPAAP